MCAFINKIARELICGCFNEKGVTKKANASVVPSAYTDRAEYNCNYLTSDASDLLSSADASTPNFTSNSSNTSIWIREKNQIMYIYLSSLYAYKKQPLERFQQEEIILLKNCLKMT